NEGADGRVRVPVWPRANDRVTVLPIGLDVRRATGAHGADRKQQHQRGDDGALDGLGHQLGPAAGAELVHRVGDALAHAVRSQTGFPSDFLVRQPGGDRQGELHFPGAEQAGLALPSVAGNHDGRPSGKRWAISFRTMDTSRGASVPMRTWLPLTPSTVISIFWPPAMMIRVSPTRRVSESMFFSLGSIASHMPLGQWHLGRYGEEGEGRLRPASRRVSPRCEARYVGNLNPGWRINLRCACPGREA